MRGFRAFEVYRAERVQILSIFNLFIRFSRKLLSTILDFSQPYNYIKPFSTPQPVSEYGCKPKPAQLREEGWEVSEGRGGGMTGT